MEADFTNSDSNSLILCRTDGCNPLAMDIQERTPKEIKNYYAVFKRISQDRTTHCRRRPGETQQVFQPRIPFAKKDRVSQISDASKS